MANKRTHLHLIVNLHGSPYTLYRDLQAWLDEQYVHVTKVEKVDKDTLAVFYEKL
jgi:hypothetical protein